MYWNGIHVRPYPEKILFKLSDTRLYFLRSVLRTRLKHNITPFHRDTNTHHIIFIWKQFIKVQVNARRREHLQYRIKHTQVIFLRGGFILIYKTNTWVSKVSNKSKFFAYIITLYGTNSIPGVSYFGTHRVYTLRDSFKIQRRRKTNLIWISNSE